MSGPQSAQNPFRFSTKLTEEDIGLVYYGYRYYAPGTARWTTRDSIGERGGLNPYGFVYNNPINGVDTDGRQYQGWPRPSPPANPLDPPDPQPYWPPPPGWKPPEKAKIKICNRPLDPGQNATCKDNCVVGIGNLIGHGYVDYGEDPNGNRRGYGLFDPEAKKGDFPQLEIKLPVLKPTSCRNCYKASGLTLQHGGAKGKKGSEASDDEIWDCISKHQLTKDYSELNYNCFGWANEATSACGLACQ